MNKCRNCKKSLYDNNDVFCGRCADDKDLFISLDDIKKIYKLNEIKDIIPLIYMEKKYLQSNKFYRSRIHELIRKYIETLDANDKRRIGFNKQEDILSNYNNFIRIIQERRLAITKSLDMIYLKYDHYVIDNVKHKLDYDLDKYIWQIDITVDNAIIKLIRQLEIVIKEFIARKEREQMINTLLDETIRRGQISIAKEHFAYKNYIYAGSNTQQSLIKYFERIRNYIIKLNQKDHRRLALNNYILFNISPKYRNIAYLSGVKNI